MEEELFEPIDYSQLLEEDDRMRRESLCFSPINIKINSSSSASLRFRSSAKKIKNDEPSLFKSKIKLYNQSIKREGGRIKVKENGRRVDNYKTSILIFIINLRTKVFF